MTAVVGKGEIMKFAEETFISSTFWTERIGSVAGLKTLEVMEKIQSWKIIDSIGKKIINKWKKIASDNNVKIDIFGLPALCTFRFKSENHLKYKTFLTQEMLKKNILASNVIYLSVAHDKKMIDKYFVTLEKIFKKINQCENENLDISALLETSKCISGMRDK